MDTPPQRTYPPGVPCWIDTEQPDVDATTAFYGDLFGWSFEERPTGGAGRYLIAHLEGAPVAGVASGDGSAHDWNTYVRVADVDQVTAAARTAGATITHEPQDAGPAGRWAGFADPGGARLRLWQPGLRVGVQVANVPGAWNFTDLHTSDPVSGIRWYEGLFGWIAVDVGFATMLRVPGYGQHLADTVDPNIMERQQTAPDGFEDAIGWVGHPVPGQPASWATTFTVADRDAAAERAVRLGAILLGQEETAWTRSAAIRDPQGAELTLSQFTPPDDW